MNFFEMLLLDIILLLFPLMVYFIYSAYSKTLDFNKNNLYFDLSLFSSYYLLVRMGNLEINNLYILILDILLLLAFLKRKNISIIILSVLMIIYYYNIFKINIFIFIYEYLMYIFLYLYRDKKLSFTNWFIIIKSILFLICYILSGYYITYDLILTIILFILLSYFTIYLFIKTDETFSLYRQVKNIEKESQIKESLFKITHEIKNPIAVCKGYLDMFDINNINHSKKYIPIIKSEINRVLSLLEDFLSITKIKVEKEEMDITVLLEDTVYCLKHLLNEKQVNFISNIPKDEIYINADYNRLKQTLVNIIKNSLESIDKDGYIILSTKRNKKEIKIIIEDNGVGMTEEELSKIKEAFFTTKKNGTGLGIYMSNEIIQMHNGTLEYFSEKDKGTKVVITLPYNR